MLFGTGVSLALVYITAVLPVRTGETPAIKPTFYPVMFQGMIVVPVTRNTAVHVHHWVIYSALLLFCREILGPLGFGFCLTLAVQGFVTYQDRLQFMQKNPWFSSSSV